MSEATAKPHWKTLKKAADAAALLPISNEVTLDPSSRDAKITQKLDRARPFGEIYGSMDECPSARYVQDGCLFDKNSDLITNG